MPRQMPPYATWLQRRVFEAVALAHAGDLVVATAAIGTSLRSEWPVSRVELLYEIAYLRIFVEWEQFLEATFIRYLCGYASSWGTCPLAAGNYCSTLAAAESAMLGGRPFALWHSPFQVVTRAHSFFNLGFHEIVVASNTSRLVDLAALRHRIVHGQKDAIQNFDNATMNFTGKRYKGARPGRFLRDWDRSVTPQKRWLETLGLELVHLAQQIA